MKELIVCLTNRTAISHIKELIERNDWERVLVLSNRTIANEFNVSRDIEMILVNSSQATEELVEEIMEKVKIKGMEVALNLFSGTGKEHMAILAALLKKGLGIRLVKQGKELKEI